jgi:hypothetical protein
LNCLSGEYDVPEARGTAPSVARASDLETQKTAGFYEYGLNSEYGKRAVAYVVPPGQLDRVPASVRKLPIIEALETETRSFVDGSTVAIVASWAFLAVPPKGVAAKSSKPRRKLARASYDYDIYGCPSSHFCLYDYQNWQGPRYGLHGIGTGWQSLNACCSFSDRAESVRNRRANDSLLNRNNPATGGGNDGYCSDSHSSDLDLDNNFGGGGRNVASSFALVPDDIHC